jgi:hypothetical protein
VPKAVAVETRETATAKACRITAEKACKTTNKINICKISNNTLGSIKINRAINMATNKFIRFKTGSTIKINIITTTILILKPQTPTKVQTRAKTRAKIKAKIPNTHITNTRPTLTDTLNSDNKFTVNATRILVVWLQTSSE